MYVNLFRQHCRKIMLEINESKAGNNDFSVPYKPEIVLDFCVIKSTLVVRRMIDSIIEV